MLSSPQYKWSVKRCTRSSPPSHNMPRSLRMVVSSTPKGCERIVGSRAFLRGSDSDNLPISFNELAQIGEVGVGSKLKEKMAEQFQTTDPTSQRMGTSSLVDAWRRLVDKVMYNKLLPVVGFHLSYARLLQLLQQRKVKRIIMLGDGKTAIVEIVIPRFESNPDTILFDPVNPNIEYAEELPEWTMEKIRYYVDLPGDVYSEGTFLALIKRAQERRVVDEDGNVRVPYADLLRVGEVRPELEIVDPSDSWVWINSYRKQLLALVGLILLRGVVEVGMQTYKLLGGKEKKSKEEEMAEQLGAHRAKEYNVERKGGKKMDTGIRYSDVAGIDNVKQEIVELLDLLLGEKHYVEVGAKPIRGVLLEGPPGTGKTLLAKAMAGEAGIPFLSANGAEFVEMYSGVAAARVRSLFKAARKRAPAIVFIDEIDALGKARSSSGGGDAGTREREQGLLQLLTEMDGFVRDDKILVVGATNRADILDDALVRPGRFGKKVYMGQPTPDNRMKILEVHARGKTFEDGTKESILQQVAEMTIGFSGAELANLMNEAAILSVRRDSLYITMVVMKEALDKIRLGLPHTSLPNSDAKKHYAMVQAARAVAFALTPGLPRIEHVTIRPRGNAQARIVFEPQENRKDGGSWNALTVKGVKTNAAEISQTPSAFELACALLVPLYVARCSEEILLGDQSVTLLTSQEISKAGELARWIVMDSKLHPKYRDDALLRNLQMGGKSDPTTQWLRTQFDKDILDMQEVAYKKARQIVEERREVISQIATELLTKEETVSGTRIVELLSGQSVIVPTAQQTAEEFIEAIKITEEDGSALSRLMEVITGEKSLNSGERLEKMREQLLNPEVQAKLAKAIRETASSLNAWEDSQAKEFELTG